MKNVPRKKKVMVMIILTIATAVFLLLVISIFAYNRYIRNAGVLLGGYYEKIRITETTREIPLEFVCQFDIIDDLRYYYYDIMPVKVLNKEFDTDFEAEDTWVVISHGRKIGQLVYDINWRLFHYEEMWGSIAVPKFEHGFSPNTIYVYISDFPLYELYTGFLHPYVEDIRYINDEQEWDVQVWGTDNPSPKRIWWLDFNEWKRRIFPRPGSIEDSDNWRMG
jgi:hypothetical protein